MSDIETIQCPIELQLQEQALNLAKTKAKWNGCKSLLGPVVNAVAKLGIEPTFGYCLDISFSGDAKRLAAVVRILRISGWNSNAAKPVKGDTSWHAIFDHPDTQVTIWMYFTSSVCKRVKTGTKMVETDIYEVQCGDISGTDTELPALPNAVPALDRDAASGIENIPF